MVVIVSHDAGGAEVLSSYVRRREIDCIYVLEGPAKRIFQRKLGPIKCLPLKKAIQQSESVLCGTSWQSSLEFDAIKLARSQTCRSVAFLDHWVNYRERFVRAGECCLPDEIWVGDRMAETLAQKAFPTTTIRVVENPYFQDIHQELKATHRQRVSKSDSIRVLYICEPIGEHALLQFGNERQRGYVEEDALRYFLANVKVLGKPIERLVLRPHPSEQAGKYDGIKLECEIPIEIGGTHTLIEEIVNSDVVIGCESMAMVIGLLAEKRVISCIPPGGKPCDLPYQEIENLQVL